MSVLSLNCILVHVDTAHTGGLGQASANKRAINQSISHLQRRSAWFCAKNGARWGLLCLGIHCITPRHSATAALSECLAAVCCTIASSGPVARSCSKQAQPHPADPPPACALHVSGWFSVTQQSKRNSLMDAPRSRCPWSLCAAPPLSPLLSSILFPSLL